MLEVDHGIFTIAPQVPALPLREASPFAPGSLAGTLDQLPLFAVPLYELQQAVSGVPVAAHRLWASRYIRFEFRGRCSLFGAAFRALELRRPGTIAGLKGLTSESADSC